MCGELREVLFIYYLLSSKYKMCSFYLILSTSYLGRCYDPHFIDKDATNLNNFLKAKRVVSSNLNPDLSDSKIERI